MKPARLIIIALVVSVAAFAHANDKVVVTVEQRIQGAARALGYFQKDHRAEDFQSVILTLSEINSDRPSGAPLDQYWEIRERQIKDSLSAWFLVFRTLDSLKSPTAGDDRCYFNLTPPSGFVGMDPKDVKDARERAAYEQRIAENDARCERQSFQLLLPRLDADAQLAFRKALQGLATVEGIRLGSHFAYAVGKSDLSGERSRQVWSIFDHIKDDGWKPVAVAPPPDSQFEFSENAKPDEVDSHISQWLQSVNPREVAWAAYYAARDNQKNAIPALLAYVHRQAYDPVFEGGADQRGMRSKKLITEDEAKRPLRTLIIGSDSRDPSRFGRKPALTGAPFPDVTPLGTEIRWQDRYARGESHPIK